MREAYLEAASVKQKAIDFEENPDAASIRVLLNKVVMDIELKDPQYNEEIVFVLRDESRIKFVAECVSCGEGFEEFRNASWIESIEGLENIVGEEIVSVIEKDLENVESSAVYNVDLVSSKGTCTIDFRNDNRHYGASLVRSWKLDNDST